MSSRLCNLAPVGKKLALMAFEWELIVTYSPIPYHVTINFLLTEIYFLNPDIEISKFACEAERYYNIISYINYIHFLKTACAKSNHSLG